MILIRVASTPEEIAAVRALWSEYWAELGLADDFQDFAAELARLPGPYTLLLAAVEEQAAGTIALRRNGENSCEAKRLFVRPGYRGLGIAKSLLSRVIELARSEGYIEMFGDSLPSMVNALDMYRRFGFRETGPYNDHPTPGAIYLGLPLLD